ncbi:MAG: ectoine hydroxylase [Pirellulaceae bacterium]|jgi:ectoine hydroxylase
MNTQPLTVEQVEQFQRDGYLFVENLLDAEETKLLCQAAKLDSTTQDAAMGVKDTSGRRTNLSLWNHAGDDIYGVIARSERVVYSMQQLLDDEVYHYHSKLSAKEPKVGGAWEWHQDYGYWYENGCLFPDMASVFIAVDDCTKENGCLQVLRGSHLLGRVAHGPFGEQTGADPERVAEARKRMELVYCEMAAGTGLYFHSNLLHASDANLSDSDRWGLLCCYNTKHNDPYIDSHHPRYTPLDVLPDSAIKEVGAKAASADQEFLQQDEDQTTG